MKITKIETNKIIEKAKQLEKVKVILKTEFIGLDNVINDVIEYIKPFYIFPKSIKRPLIVNLFGMTATGKTHLIERIVCLLDLQEKYFRFDVGEYASASEWKLRTALTKSLNQTEEKNMVFVFDEIQMGRTISEKGEEIDRNGLRPMWELIDSGVIGMEPNNNLKLLKYVSFLDKLDFDVIFDENLNTNDVNSSNVFVRGINNLGLISKFDFFDSGKLDLSLLCESDAEKIRLEFNDLVDSENMFNVLEYSKTNKRRFYVMSGVEADNKRELVSIIPEDIYKKLIVLNPKFFCGFNRETYLDFLNTLKNKDSIINHFRNIITENYSIMEKVDYSQSIIFCIGNIDEAYSMSHTSNPDADADIFHEHSLKITQPIIKDALSKRFRMEQIGRLGNNIVIYPSFSIDSYKKIIKKLLGVRIEYFKTEFKINLKFTDTLEDIFYKESVFPSQGVRPILSSISSFIDSYVCNVVTDILINKINATDVLWSFNRDKSRHEITATSKNKEVIFLYEVTLKIDDLRKTDYSENQTYTAIHESGHALVSIVKSKIIPKLIMSKTASTAEGFCRIEQPDIKTRETEYNNILVCLGGRAAEKFVLNNEDMLSTGSYSDLVSATETANKMIKAFGHGNNSFVIRHSQNELSSFNSENLLLNAEEEALLLIKRGQEEVDKIILENKQFLMEMIELLSNKSQLCEKELLELTKKYNIETKNKSTYYNIKERIVEFKKEHLL